MSSSGLIYVERAVDVYFDSRWRNRVHPQQACWWHKAEMSGWHTERPFYHSKRPGQSWQLGREPAQDFVSLNTINIVKCLVQIDILEKWLATELSTDMSWGHLSGICLGWSIWHLAKEEKTPVVELEMSGKHTCCNCIVQKAGLTLTLHIVSCLKHFFCHLCSTDNRPYPVIARLLFSWSRLQHHSVNKGGI